MHVVQAMHDNWNALLPLFAGVRSLMARKISGNVKGLLAYPALERLLSSVRPLVTVQKDSMNEAFLAESALERSVAAGRRLWYARDDEIAIAEGTHRICKVSRPYEFAYARRVVRPERKLCRISRICALSQRHASACGWSDASAA